MSLSDILAEVAETRVHRVCVTGGEPLAQTACCLLLRTLCDAGYDVSLETSGALDISGVDPRVSRVLDLKAPASGECRRNRWENLDLLSEKDEIKFVLANRADYDWACRCIRERDLGHRSPILFSPVAGELPATDLAAWILADRLPVRLQIQLHKLLWGNMRGR